MNAFLSIDHCRTCRRSLPWEWIPAVILNGKTLPGTGVWGTPLENGRCGVCITAAEEERHREVQQQRKERALVQILGGKKPFREFTFERFTVLPGNRLASERCEAFNPAVDNLFLWGACGVGKTHLAWATARHCFEESLSVVLLRAFELSRRVRMRDPASEQAGIDEFVEAEVLVLDDLGAGANTAYSRQLLQEILDGRSFQDRAGLVITSRYSLDELAAKLDDDAVSSRVAGMCTVVHVHGPDGRLTMRKSG